MPVLLYGYGGFDLPLGPQSSVLAAVFIEHGGVYVLRTYAAGKSSACLARRWPPRAQAARLRRLRGRRTRSRTIGPVAPGTDHDPRRVERGPARGHVDHPTPRGVRRRRRRGGGARHAAVPQVHDRLGVVVRLRRLRRPRAVPVAARVLAAPQHPRRREVSGDAASHRGTTTIAVVPAHSFKFAAALQRAQGGDAPILLRVETSAGHGAGKPTNTRPQSADVLTFVEGRSASAPTTTPEHVDYRT